MNQTLDPETAAFAMLIGAWQTRFITLWTMGEIVDWRERFVKNARKASR